MSTIRKQYHMSTIIKQHNISAVVEYVKFKPAEGT